ncbi:MAG: hypothetical protein P1U56_21565 [Saprospiraceae bacterium]|nr:hypothetical protein [Saprospiraceae bacterium]
MNEIKEEDIKFLDEFLADELTEEGLKELDRRLKDPDFKNYYKLRLKQKYSISPIRLFMAYLPMILLIVLCGLGIYLILTKL